MGAGRKSTVCEPAPYLLLFCAYHLCSYREDANEVVEEYYATLGGRPQKPATGRKRKSVGAAKPTAEKLVPKRQRKSKGAGDTESPHEVDLSALAIQANTWEDDVQKVDTITRDPNGSLVAYLVWKTGGKTRVSIETCYQKCPQQASYSILSVSPL
jgi:chromobox protein 1